MNRTQLLGALTAVVALGVLAADASAYYHPTMGRFMSRDPGAGGPPRPGSAGPAVSGGFIPRDQYVDGMNLYQYVRSNPIIRLDPTGLWGEDIHLKLTRQLAQAAGIACADDMAAGANRPDNDYWRRPGFAGVADIMAVSALGSEVRDFKVNQMAEWHFPASPNGKVEPDSVAANAKVTAGRKTCDFTLFSEGLHVLQDSWAHQGTPYLWGKVGHGRGATWVRDWEWQWIPGRGYQYIVVADFHWERTDGTLHAATSVSKGYADDVEAWPKSARATGEATYRELLKFKRDCDCHCPGPNNTKVATSSGDARPAKEIEQELLRKFPGDGAE